MRVGEKRRGYNEIGSFIQIGLGAVEAAVLESEAAESSYHYSLVE